MPAGSYTLIIILAAGWTTLTCLRIVAAYLDNSVRWHNLKVEAHQLRRKQMLRLHQISQRRSAPISPAGSAQFDVDVLGESVGLRESAA